MKALLLGLKADSILTAQLEPFADERKSLRRQLDLNVQYIETQNLAQMEEACQKYDSEAVFFFPFWREDASEVVRTFQKIRSEYPDRQLIFVDPFAQGNTMFLGVLPYVDVLLKRQRFRDLNDYKREFVGGNEFIEFIARHWNIDLEGWSVSSEVPEGYEHRIASGWSLGTARRFRKALRPPLFFPKRPISKKLDVFCRLSLGHKRKQEWYCEYRMAAAKALEPLESDYQIAVSALFIDDGLISKKQYARELRQSRIVFSPFGWGETCWRDFEAICNDSLLVKPSMAHLDTQPNIFVENETYVPVRWDFADLEEKCRHYLEHPEEAARIIKNARQVYTDYLERGGFARTLEDILSKNHRTDNPSTEKLSSTL
ncbi:MAG: glycosyltransferase [Cyanobacteriota bacterium]|nr:glycosyltransferase [Cyanobacteriota bacterium]